MSGFGRVGAAVGGLVVLVAVAVTVLHLTDRNPGGAVPALNWPLESDLSVVVGEFTGDLRPEGPYRDPSASELRTAESAVGNLLDRGRAMSDAAEDLAALGFARVDGVDSETDRAFSLFASRPADERAWAMLVMDPTRQAEFLIQVPHPNSDLNTDRLGVEVFRHVPGSVLLIAGAHRRAGGESADVAHNRETVFHAMAREFGRRGVSQLQLHGYADSNLPDSDFVVSVGQARRTAGARDLADALEAEGYAVCRAWRRRCGQLEGTTNVQGQTARSLDVTFIHLEISWRVRSTVDGRRSVAEAIGRVASTWSGPSRRGPGE